MATYKVLQDIEADDKLLGPLSLKQFIFAAVFVGMGFVQFLIITSPAPAFVKVPLIVALVLPMLLFGFLAAPIGRDQPSEVWLLARLNFLFKPRQRIWNQDGISDLVTITAPKREVHVYTDGLSQTEVKSRLHALANTVDSRGWAVKNVNTNLFTQPGYLGADAASDRLVDPMSLPQDVPATDVTASDDIFDTANSSTAQRMDQLIQQSSASHRQQVVASMKPSDPSQAQQTPTDYWFMNQTAPQDKVAGDFATFNNRQVVAPGTDDVHPAAAATDEEEALVHKIAEEQQEAKSHINGHMRVLQPLHDREGKIIIKDKPRQTTDPALLATASKQPSDDQGQKPVNPAILGLAHNDDLNVATIARQAKRLSEDDGEVVISLH